MTNGEKKPEKSPVRSSGTSDNKSSVHSGSDVPEITSMLENIKIPYGQFQQQILARKTKMLDMNIENQLRQKVLSLSLDIDQMDTEV